MQEYETILKKMIRREKYLTERDNYFGLRYYGSEKELYLLHPIPKYTGNNSEERMHKCLCTAVYYALNDLKAYQPRWYEIICLYYLGEPVSITYLGKRYGVTRQAVSKVLKKALRFLRIRAVAYFDELWNT